MVPVMPTGPDTLSAEKRPPTSPNSESYTIFTAEQDCQKLCLTSFGKVSRSPQTWKSICPKVVLLCTPVGKMTFSSTIFSPFLRTVTLTGL